MIIGIVLIMAGGLIALIGYPAFCIAFRLGAAWLSLAIGLAMAFVGIGRLLP